MWFTQSDFDQPGDSSVPGKRHPATTQAVFPATRQPIICGRMGATIATSQLDSRYMRNVMMAVVLTGRDVVREDLVRVARGAEKVTLDPGATARMEAARSIVERR